MKKNIFFNLLYVILSISFPILIIPMLTGTIGISGYGDYVTLLAYSALINIFFDVGLEMGAPTILRKFGERDIWVLNIIAFKLIASFFSIFIYIFFFPIEYDNASNLIYVSLLYHFLFSIRPIGVLNALNLYKIVAFSELLGKVVFLALIIIWLKAGFDIVNVITFQVVNLGIINFIYYNSLRKNVKTSIDEIKLYNLYVILYETKNFFISRFFINVYTQSSTYIVSKFTQSDVVALYSIAHQLFKVGSGLIGSVSKVLYTTNIEKKVFKIIQVMALLTLAWVFGLCIVWIFGYDIFLLIFNDEKAKFLNELSKIFYISLLFNMISSILGYPLHSVIGGNINKAHLGVLLGSSSYFLLLISVFFLDDVTVYHFAFLVLITEFITSIVRCFFGIPLLKSSRSI